MEGIKALTEERSGKWYQVGMTLAKTLSPEFAQNLFWNLGYMRQGLYDVINSRTAKRDSQSAEAG